jgi:signal transduction histidine kinase
MLKQVETPSHHGIDLIGRVAARCRMAHELPQKLSEPGRRVRDRGPHGGLCFGTDKPLGVLHSAEAQRKARRSVPAASVCLGFLHALPLLWVCALLSSAGAEDLGIVPTGEGSRVLTNIGQFAQLPPAEARWGRPFHLVGAATWVDAERNLLVLQDATGAMAVDVDFKGVSLRPGQLVAVEGVNGSPYIAAFPAYPNRPSGSQIRKTFEAPSNWGDFHLSRMRAFLHPRVTGEYTFWIASDNSSDLLLSPDDNPARARRIAFINPGNWVNSREWSRFPSQHSETIPLRAGQAYYIEAMQEQLREDDNLAVAWQGPGLSQSVIDGDYFAPFPGAASNSTPPDKGILWEYWTNYFAGNVSELTGPRPFDSRLTVKEARLKVLGEAVLPEPRRITLDQTLSEEDNYRWVEVEGEVSFFGNLGNSATLELTDGQGRALVQVQNWKLGSSRLQNWRVRVRGVCECVRDKKGQRVAGSIWAATERNISPIAPTKVDWNSSKTMPLHGITPANPNLAWGQRVHVAGVVVRQVPGESLRIRSGDTFYGFVSNDGTNWTQMGWPIEVPMSNSVRIGLAVTSHADNRPTTAIFEQVSGLSPGALSTDIGAPAHLGRSSYDGSAYTVTGSGRDIWHDSDQFHFVSQPLEGDGEITAQVKALENTSPWAKAGVMVRESLDSNSKFVDLVVTPLQGTSLQYRRIQMEWPSSVDNPACRAPYWVRLSRRHHLLSVRTQQTLPLNAGGEVEVMGYLDWEGGTPILIDALYREVPSEATVPSVAPAAGSDTEPGPLSRIPIKLLLSGISKTSGIVGFRIRGVVTFNDHVLKEDCLFIQDDSAGIFISWTNHQSESQFQVGQLVEFEGDLLPGKFAPSLRPLTAEVLGWSRMPQPSVQPPESARRDGQWTELEGVLRSVDAAGMVLMMGAKGPVSIWIGHTSTNVLGRYISATVRVRGVMSLSTHDRPVLLVPSPAFLEVEEQTPEDPFVIPSLAIANLNSFDTTVQWVHRAKATGVVTYRHERSLFMQDASGGLRVRAAANAPLVQVGDEVEVVGFPEGSGYSQVLSEALVRSKGSSQSLKPATLDMNELASVRHSSTLVRVQANLMGQETAGANQILNLQEGQQLFQAILALDQGRLPSLPAGSQLELTGVCQVELVDRSAGDQAPESRPIASLRICLRSPLDVVMVKRPPWWTWDKAAALVGILLVVLMAALLWIRLLRLRLEGQRAAQRVFARQILQNQEGERRRIAANLHDSLGQNLLVIKNQARLAMNTATDGSSLRERLEEISGVASQAIEEVRQITHDLRPYQLDRLGLTKALRATLKQVSENCRILFASHVDDIDGLFDKASEIHFYRIIQEGINNIVKHSAATEATVVVKRQAASVSVSLRDNGRGFEAGLMNSAGLGDAGFGLSGMSERARILGGKLTIESRPSQGTNLTLEIPSPGL